MLRSQAVTLLLALSLATVAGCSGKLDSAEEVSQAESDRLNGDHHAAALRLKSLLAQQPQIAPARFLLGDTLLFLGDAAAAEKEFSKAVEYGYPPAEASPMLALALLQQYKFDAVLELAEDPQQQTNSDLIVSKALAHLRKGDVWTASELLEVADSEYGPSAYSLSVSALLDISTNKLADAQTKALKASELDPSFALAWAAISSIEQQQDNPQQALASLRKAIALEPHNLQFRLSELSYLLAMENFNEVAEALRPLLAKYPDSPILAFVSGRLAFAEGDYKGAITAFDKALAFNPNLARAQLFAAHAHWLEGNGEQAAQLATTYYKAYPNNVAARILLASIAYSEGQLSEAANYIEPVVIAVREANPLLMYAGILIAQGKTNEAKHVVRQLEQLPELSTSSQLRLAAAQVAVGEPANALINLKALTQASPDYLPARQFYISQLAAQGEVETALNEVALYERDFPGQANVTTLQAKILIAQGQLDNAEKILTDQLESNRGDAASSSLLAQLMLKQGRLADAESLLEVSLDRSPNNLRLLMQLASIAARQGDGDYMASLLEQAVEHNPTAHPPRVLLARYHATQGDMEKAEFFMAGIDEEAFELSDVMHTESLLAIAQGDYQTAASKIDVLIERHPDAAKLHYMRARLAAESDDVDGMLKALNKAAALNPDNIQLKIELARAKYAAGDKAGFRKLTNELAKSQLNNASVVTLQATLARLDGNPEKAEQHLQNAFEIAPTSKSLQRLTNQLDLNGKSDQAQALRLKWLESNPKDIVVRLVLAEKLSDEGQFEQARTHLTTVIQYDQNNLIALNNLAWYLRNTQPLEAITYIEQAAKLQTDSTTVQHTAAAVYLAANAPKKANAAIDRALQLQPKNGEFLHLKAEILVSLDELEEAKNVLELALSTEEDYELRAESQMLLNTLSSD